MGRLSGSQAAQARIHVSRCSCSGWPRAQVRLLRLAPAPMWNPAQDDWLRRAELAVSKNEDDLAKEALRRRCVTAQVGHACEAQKDVCMVIWQRKASLASPRVREQT